MTWIIASTTQQKSCYWLCTMANSPSHVFQEYQLSLPLFLEGDMLHFNVQIMNYILLNSVCISNPVSKLQVWLLIHLCIHDPLYLLLHEFNKFILQRCHGNSIIVKGKSCKLVRSSDTMYVYIYMFVLALERLYTGQMESADTVFYLNSHFLIQ